jgi:uncharacterized protein (UPF0147 family)
MIDSKVPKNISDGVNRAKTKLISETYETVVDVSTGDVFLFVTLTPPVLPAAVAAIVRIT